MLLKEIKYESGTIQVYGSEKPVTQQTIDTISKIILNYYKRNTA